MHKTVVITALVLAASFGSNASANAISVTLDPSTPTGSLLPNTPGEILLAFDAAVELNNDPVELLQFNFQTATSGGAGIQNLSLWQDGLELGQVVANPGPSASFTVPFLIGTGVSDMFVVRGDILNSTGTVQITLPANGLTGEDINTLAVVDAPDSLIAGSTLQVTNAPEPGTWMAIPCFAAVIFLAQRRKKV